MRSVPAAKAECRLWVQKEDDRRNAPQWARRAASGRSRDGDLTAGFDPKSDIAGVRENGVTVEARSNDGVVFMHWKGRTLQLSPHHAPRELTRRQAEQHSRTARIWDKVN